MSALKIGQAGIATSVQDSGRAGTLQLGIPPSGAMDPYALVSGQYQLGHTHDEAALEMAYADLIATSTHDCHIVITGAPVTLTIDDQGVDPRTIHAINAGQTLRIRATTMGIYSYLHISGGIATEPVFQSRSTSPREVLGGLEGRYLRDGDTLPIGPTQSAPVRDDPLLELSPPGSTLTLRFVPGFQHDDFSPTAISALLETEFSVTPSANRMGVKLSGGDLHSGIESLLSEATCYGAIQVPPDGAPIVLLNDRQTVGGYPKPGAVISSDCARLAQARPGQKIRFVSRSAAEADRIQWLERHYVETRLQ